MTITMLLKNTVTAAALAEEKRKHTNSFISKILLGILLRMPFFYCFLLLWKAEILLSVQIKKAEEENVRALS